jgi:hypothetical protein
MLALVAAVVIGSQLALRCSESDPGLKGGLAAADALAAEHRVDEAIAAYARLSDQFPRDPRVWLAYGDALLELRADYAGADGAYAHADELASGSAAAAAPAALRRGMLAWVRERPEAEALLRHAADGGDAAARRALAIMAACPRSRAAALAAVIVAWPPHQR